MPYFKRFADATRHVLATMALLLTASALSGCLVIADYRIIPHANLMVVVPAELSETDVLDRIEQELHWLGYTRQPNDWESWTFLDEERLEAKKREREYFRESFRLSYRPEVSDEYQKLGRLHLHFYEEGEYQFTELGEAQYKELSAALTRVGFPPASHDDLDVKHAREVRSPAWFNERHQPPSVGQRAKVFAYALFGLIPYALIVIWPGFRWAMIITKELNWSRPRRYTVFCVMCGALFAPAPLPLTMFGPALLVPLPIVFPFVLGAPFSFAFSLLASALVTSAVAAAVLAVVIHRESRRVAT